jgi:hypothetical protein
MDENKVREIIRQELKGLLGLNSFIFEKNIKIFDGRNIQLGKTTGTKIGTEGGATGQKIGFFGATPVLQQLKANHNNWANISDVVSALVNLGLLDQ